MTTAARAIGLTVLLALVATGCASAAPDSGTPAGRSTGMLTAAPTGTPADPPSSVATPGPSSAFGTRPPSDLISGYWVMGSVAADSAGPCYRLTTDDGRALNLYGNNVGALQGGTRIGARVVDQVKQVDCAGTETMWLLEIKPAG